MTPFKANYGFEPVAPWAVAPAPLDMPDIEVHLGMLQEVHSVSGLSSSGEGPDGYLRQHSSLAGFLSDWQQGLVGLTASQP
mmetsp:Transcript_29835/g.75095  ORF Transcript_29835/g.75095 Transcript_29835/m.75095 type:complete len:81 (+) Transcript_29835:141-383(+)